ncbi:hypothetical protein JH06_0467 [Blastocystis sp. subtype 4]|uniref:hypothetical protein n=1 Tax=Blastocystis sp. subtype 4 TaxID=944170 RepID=UPI0007116891|nr:hypothetical protein JH06_0467 [Blastocystis sp. subtype 4]KNB45920.1 hypothetical protein JH06_0467 [Blastocystis sp. subtype 4]|eukprot:XP_014529363.1 hypothetical protein JH06_0467 [Blastocystis sp. subtype 4]
MTEWGEGVMTLSNSSHSSNYKLFEKARFSISMNQFDHFSVSKDLKLMNDDLQEGGKNGIPENVAISTEVKSLQDTYSFYTNNSLNKQIFHINELLNSSGATLHIDNRTDLSFLPVIINEAKVLMNNMDNQLIIAVTMVYAVNCLILFNWIIDLPEVFNVAALYVLLFLVIPLLSLCLFSATPELTESRQFLQLPWKPINKGETLSVPKSFTIRFLIRMALITFFLIFSSLIAWSTLIWNYSPYSNSHLFAFLIHTEIKKWMYSEDINAQSLVSISNLFSLICSEWFCFLLCGMMMNRNRTVVESFREPSSRGLVISFILILLFTVCLYIYCYVVYSRMMLFTISGWIWLVLVAFGVIVLLTDTYLLKRENTTTSEMNQIYRWNFNIRLGMYSPELCVC